MDTDRGPTESQPLKQTLTKAAFLLICPAWDCIMAEGKGSLLVYHRPPLAGLKAAAREPANSSKVCDVRQGADESPVTFVECL